jgi:hypothetical protein
MDPIEAIRLQVRRNGSPPPLLGHTRFTFPGH